MPNTRRDFSESEDTRALREKIIDQVMRREITPEEAVKRLNALEREKHGPIRNYLTELVG